MKITPIDSIEEMFAEIHNQLAEADKRVSERQKQAKIGDYFLRLAPEADNLMIYGEILDPSKPVASDNFTYTEEDLKEIEGEAKIYEAPHMKYMKFTYCYSVACPDGELGDTHCSSMHKFIKKETFDTAKHRGWPTSKETVRDLLRDCGESIELDFNA